jgi:hypothetical protein
MPEIDIERVFELGVVLAARTLWEELGIGPAIRACTTRAKLTVPHETALFAMVANRLDNPVSKLACAERWLAWLPDAAGLAVDRTRRRRADIRRPPLCAVASQGPQQGRPRTTSRR